MASLFEPIIGSSGHRRSSSGERSCASPRYNRSRIRGQYRGLQWSRIQLQPHVCHLDRLTNFFNCHLVDIRRREDDTQSFHKILADFALVPGPRAPWSAIANDILTLDCWNDSTPSHDDLGSNDYLRDFHALCTQGRELGDHDVDDGMLNIDDDAERARLNMTTDLMREDSYAYVERSLMMITARAQGMLGPKEHLVKTVADQFRTALAVRARLAALPGGPDLSVLPPHFVFLVRKRLQTLLKDG